MTALGKVAVVPKGGGTEHRLGADRFLRKTGSPGPDDAMAVIEYVGAPGMPGPPPHVHRTFEEGWYILEGTVSFRSGEDAHPVGPGSFVHVPRGVVHTFQVVGTAPARWIGMFAPGRYLGLLEELGALLPEHGPPDGAAVARLFARYDTDLV